MKGSIYCIIDNTTGKYYIGSTNLPVEERLQHHKRDCNRWIKDKYQYVSSFEIIQNNNYSIYLIKELEYDDDEEEQLLFLERNFIEDGWREGNCVNKLSPITTEEEKVEYNKQYKIDNRDKLLEYNKQYKIDNREELLEYNTQYRNDNREYYNQYRIDNKDKLNKKFECPCGGKYTHSNKSNHEKSITHQKYINSIQSPPPP